MSNTHVKNIKLGACKVSFGGVDLGYTKGGVQVEVATETLKVTVDQLGQTTISELVAALTDNTQGAAGLELLALHKLLKLCLKFLPQWIKRKAISPVEIRYASSLA
ncbi:TPA: hypothetical protein JTO48_003372 [Escherichia coli]|nr:hypothetical protein [Escherichia coli]